MNERQNRFLKNYLSGLSPDEAARLAGYKRADMALKLLENKEIREATPPASPTESGTIADSSEILRMLTSVMRGDVHDPVVVVEQRTGKEGKTERRARVINKSASVKERMSAAEMLARRYGILDGSEDEADVIIYGEDKLIAGGDDFGEKIEAD